MGNVNKHTGTIGIGVAFPLTTWPEFRHTMKKKSSSIGCLPYMVRRDQTHLEDNCKHKCDAFEGPLSALNKVDYKCRRQHLFGHQKTPTMFPATQEHSDSCQSDASLSLLLSLLCCRITHAANLTSIQAALSLLAFLILDLLEHLLSLLLAAAFAVELM
jgi:hypothetical protein